MNKPNNIRCAECAFARQDKTASIYSPKRCKGCELNAGCTCRMRNCKCGNGCKYRVTDEICSKQTLKWKAVECGCPESEYYKSLLNVSESGYTHHRVTWTGCEAGERRDD